MRRRRVARVALPAIVAVLTVVSGAAWVGGAASRGAAPAGDYLPRMLPDLVLEGSEADQQRLSALRRAAVRTATPAHPPESATATAAPGSPLICRFLYAAPSGTTPKFDCVLDGGAVIKVKYGRSPEIHAEVAATRLLAALGFPADDVELVPRVRCYGCPRFPFLATKLAVLASMEDRLHPHGVADRYTDFENVSVERRFPAPAIETRTREGWAWYELAESTAPPGDVDALRLLAVFLAHWDNKAGNQRLVCLDDAPADGGACQRPLAMIQDLGATFGPAKVNLANWRQAPIWADRHACIASMRQLPFGGGTFSDVRISDSGRRQLARQLSSLPDDTVRRFFEDAGFPAFYSGTDDERDLAAWTQAFRERTERIRAAGPCN